MLYEVITGWGRVITDILRHREFFAKNFRQTFDENIQELRESLKADFAERTLKHVALILTPARLLYKKLHFPFSFNEITSVITSYSIHYTKLYEASVCPPGGMVTE